MAEKYFPLNLKTDWELLRKEQTVGQFWEFARSVVSGLDQGQYKNWQAAHALLSVMDMPLAEDAEVQDLLFLLPNLEIPGYWDEQSWNKAVQIILDH
jgi:hypothetical protein